MQDRPTAAELVEAVREFLERDLTEALTEALTGRTAFLARVSVNVLASVQRELELGPAHDAAQHERLRAVLGHDGDTATLERELAAAIRAGRLSPAQHAQAVAHVKATVHEKLEVANPKYLAQ